MKKDDVTGLVLAGGRASRMGGVDKGLQLLRGVPLVRHALDRLAPQVGPLMINANRHLELYAAFGAPVWPDETGDYAGPLAGVLAGMAHCATPWMVTVPCDTPRFPADLVATLAAAVDAANARIAVPVTDQRQPVFCLVDTSLQDDLREFLRGGGRKVEHWLARHACVDVPFDDADAFFNANTLDELRKLER